MRLKDQIFYFLLLGCLLTSQSSHADYLLREGLWSLTLRGGTLPTMLLHPTTLFVLNPLNPNANTSSSAQDAKSPSSANEPQSPSDIPNPLFNRQELPRFGRLFHRPWTLGFEAGYMLRCRVELFLDLAYAYGSGKSFTATVRGVQFRRDLSSYETYSGHIGGRYYFNLLEEFCLAPFIGLKVGVTHHRGMTVRQVPVQNAGQQNPEEIRLFLSTNVLSGGAQIGTDLYITDFIIFNLNAEVLIVGPIKLRQAVKQTVGNETFITGRSAFILSYPITAGFKIRF